jgi:hypothetical protein
MLLSSVSRVGLKEAIESSEPPLKSTSFMNRDRKYILDKEQLTTLVKLLYKTSEIKNDTIE